MSIKIKTIKVNKDKSLSKIQYGKKEIWWFFQWLKVCVDLEGSSIEFNQANANRQKRSTQHKIKITGWKEIDLKEIKSSVIKECAEDLLIGNSALNNSHLS